MERVTEKLRGTREGKSEVALAHAEVEYEDADHGTDEDIQVLDAVLLFQFLSRLYDALEGDLRCI